MNSFLIHASSMQVYLFGSVLIAFWLAELAICADEGRYKWKHCKTNGNFIFSALAIQLSLTPFLIAVSDFVTLHSWGLIYLLHLHLNTWLFVLILFLMLDLCEYGYHVAMHKFRTFWKFHLIHHTDSNVDVSTTVREHPVESFIRGCFVILWVFICGASPAILIIRQTIQSVANISAHTKFRLSGPLEKVIGWIFITPNLHHVHHHFERPFTDCNYGDVLSIWDRIFGTYRELKPEIIRYGIDTHMHLQNTSSFPELLKTPFKKTKNYSR